ncbi:MAG TPA: hypothetical protein VGO53_11605, partial [Steroidobacteraceae bacterium]|nr:hypothetical protein [Steroidobacteraceae bacterium]
ADGTLGGFSVNGGDVLISGAGLNATGHNYFDIVTRSLKVDGRINAHTLNVVAGTNDWSYESGSAAPVAGGPAGSGYAFDSTALGGIYADRIHIIATEAGVGVRAVGDVAASGDDFLIDSSGKIELKGAGSAVRDMRIRYTGDSAADPGAITFGAGAPGSVASLSAGRDLTLDAGSAGVTLTGGSLTANGLLTLSALTLNDSSLAPATRFGGEVAIDLRGGSTINGATWGASGNLGAHFGSLQLLGTGTRMYGANVSLASSDGNLDLGAATVQSPGDIALSAHGGTVRVSGTAGNGVLAGNDLTVAEGALDNSGDMLAGNALALNAFSLSNTGTLQATNGVVITASGSFQNDGDVLAGGALALNAADLHNTSTGTLQAGTDAAIAIANSFHNEGNTVAGGALTLAATDVVNSGTLQAATDTTVTAAQSFASSGKVLAGSALTLNTLDLQNTGSGTLQAGSNATLNATNSFNNAGNVFAGGGLTVATSAAQNAGTMQAGGNAAITATSSLTNSGKVLAGNTLNVGTGAAENMGTLQAVNGATITASSLLNSGTSALILTSTTGTSAGSISVANALTNEGAIHGNGNLAVSGGTIGNGATGGISSLGTLGVTSTSGGINNAGALYGANQLNVTANGQTFTNTLSGTVDAGNLLVNAGTFTNYNTVIIDGTATFNTTSAFNNLSGHSRAEIVGTAVTHRDKVWNGDLCHGSNALNPCGGNDANYAYYDFWTAHLSTQDVYLVDPATLEKPQIIAGTMLNIGIGAGTGHNQTGLLAAPVVNVFGTGTFTNEDLHLDAVDTQFDWTQR